MNSGLASEFLFMVRFNQTIKLRLHEHGETSMLYRTLQVTLQDVRDMQTVCRLHNTLEIERIVAEGITHQLPSHDVAYRVLEESHSLIDMLESLTFCEGLLISQSKEFGTLALSGERYDNLLRKLAIPIGENLMRRATGSEMVQRFKDLEESRQRILEKFGEPGYVESSVAFQALQSAPKDPTLN